MEARLLALAQAQGGVIGVRDAARAGVGTAELSRLVRAGELVRVRRGAFVLPTGYQDRPGSERYLQRVRAVLRSRPMQDAASHHAALALYRLPLVEVDLSRVDVASTVARSRGRAGVVVHPAPRCPVVAVGGTRALAVPVALVQTVAASGAVSGISAMDAALHQGETTIQELRAAVAHLAERVRGRVDRCIDLTDAACESPGESRTRLFLHDLGHRFQSQVSIRDAAGLVGRVDFLVEGKVVVEFDGLVKYDGATGREALVAEKLRESRLTALGYVVVRLVWADLGSPDAFARTLRLALGRGQRAS